MLKEARLNLNYSEVIENLEKRGIMPDQAPSLEPMKKGLSRILKDLKFDESKVIVVAGTNGKGSVCATLEALLLAAGQTVGLYTSPHLEQTTERIRINGQDVSEANFCKAFKHVAEATQDLFLSHFEMLTLMGIWTFYSLGAMNSPRVQWAIFEVGLGGTWDATNAIPHQNCIITPLSYDHENLLGTTLPEIAANKFGIIHKGARVIHSPLPSEVSLLASEIQITTQSHWVPSVPYELEVIKNALGEPIHILHTEWGQVPLALPGKRAAQNSALALTAFQELGFSPREHLSALQRVRWPGRMEKVQCDFSPCPIFLSGDHNPQGIASLLDLLVDYQREHLHILVGVSKDKDLDAILDPLVSLKHSSVYLTKTPFKERSTEAHGKWLHACAQFNTDPKSLLREIISKASSKDMILVTGSLYLVGLMKSWIKTEHQAALSSS